MSKERARARAVREAEAQRRAALDAERRQRIGSAHARHQRRRATWRRYRLWQHGRSFRRNQERWAALGTFVLVVLLLAYLFTGSIGAVLLVALVLLIASPALVMLFFDRSRS